MIWLTAVGVLAGGAFIYWALRQGRERDLAWRSFAAARQLAFSDGKIAGVTAGFTVAVLREDRGGSDRVRIFTVVRCSLNGALPHDFTLERETLGDKLSQLVSGADHQLGNEEMDAAFLLDRVDEQARAALSDRAVQERLLTLVRRYPGMRIGKGVLQLEVEGAVGTEEGLTAMLADAVSVANALARTRQRP